jgi:hypothetical protein
MARLIRDVLVQRAAEHFFGREDELATLLDALRDGGPPVTFVHGIAGIGKSSLLAVFAARARDSGAVVVQLDCRSIEPTERGFLHELGLALGAELSTPQDAASQLGQPGHRVVLVLDTYELLRLLDTWLRQVFVPSLGDNVRVVIAGREPPVTAWMASPGWQGLVRSMHLGPLHSREALALLEHANVDQRSAARIEQLAHGHPLALTLAANSASERQDVDLDAVAIQRVIDTLTEIYLAEVPDAVTQKALAAASVVRRVTVSVLGAMLSDVASADAVERLRVLPFVESGRDGLIIHDAVRHSIAARLRALDPEHYREYRRTAWQQLRSEVRLAGTAEIWRYTADLLYMIENPVVHDAFFPSDAHLFAVEPSRPEDERDILAISRQHDGAEIAAVVANWWSAMPDSFNTVRDRDGSVAGYYQMFVVDEADSNLLWQDPLTANWLRHLRRNPVPRGQRVLFYRRWLEREHGEVTSAVQAACWLDAKRAYMELRPNLRRVYTALRGLPAFAPVAQSLGFQPLADGVVEVGGDTYYSAMLDFGPASIDGWLSGLVGSELGIETPGLLDRDARALVVDGRKVDLTPLEFAVMHYLTEHQGKAVPRGDLLEHVWGSGYTGGSNVVDVVVRALRAKLGSQAGQLETVRGVGYRLREG